MRRKLFRIQRSALVLLSGYSFLIFSDAASAAETQKRLEHGRGFALVLSNGLSARATPAGFVVTPFDGGDVREPIEVAVDIVTPPLPNDVEACSFWQSTFRCQRRHEGGGGSLGETVTLTVYARLGKKFARYRQLKHADGFEPTFEILDWLQAGDVRLEPGH
jgi:hypothetical protein